MGIARHGCWSFTIPGRLGRARGTQIAWRDGQRVLGTGELARVWGVTPSYWHERLVSHRAFHHASPGVASCELGGGCYGPQLVGKGGSASLEPQIAPV